MYRAFYELVLSRCGSCLEPCVWTSKGFVFPVVVRSKTWFCGRSLTRIEGSNPVADVGNLHL